MDLVKAFDNVNWEKLFEITKKLGIEFKDRIMYLNEIVVKAKGVQNIYEGAEIQGCDLYCIQSIDRFDLIFFFFCRYKC